MSFPLDGVTCAVSDRLEIRTRARGSELERAYERGRPVGSLTRRESDRGDATRIAIRLDGSIFRVSLPLERARGRLQELARLGASEITWSSEGASTVLERGRAVRDIFVARFGDALMAGPIDVRSRGRIRLAATLGWSRDPGENVASYLNFAPVTGAAERGIRRAVFRALGQRGPRARAQCDGLRAVVAVECPGDSYELMGSTRTCVRSAAIEEKIARTLRPRVSDLVRQNPALRRALAN